MGINALTYPILQRYIDSEPVALMGNLYMRRGVLKDYPGASRYASLFLRAVHGATVVSFDIKPRRHARAWNLNRPLVGFDNYFGVVFNGGTGEHVKNQGVFWDNCHRIVKPGGVMIHVVPLVGGWRGHPGWPDHSPYLYTKYFLHLLADYNSYNMVERTVFMTAHGAAMCAVLRHTGADYKGVPVEHVVGNG